MFCRHYYTFTDEGLHLARVIDNINVPDDYLRFTTKDLETVDTISYSSIKWFIGLTFFLFIYLTKNAYYTGIDGRFITLSWTIYLGVIIS